VITTQATTRVLVVDGSALARTILTRELGRHDGIQVVGTAPDCRVARDQITILNPDVLTLDIEMPRLDGITFLRELMQHHPMPVIVFSSLTPAGSTSAVEALEAGAVEVLCKPGGSCDAGAACRLLAEKITAVSQGGVPRHPPVRRVPAAVTRAPDTVENANRIFAIGASTGGVRALHCVLSALPRKAPGTVVVQHMPPSFTASFAEQLNHKCAVDVKEAEDGDPLLPGTVLIAPGGLHLLLRRSGPGFSVALNDGPLVCHQKPSVEVLFNSVAQCAGASAVGAILTGMGDDGATGLLNMRRAGAHTIAQDEPSCVVFGMPKEAIARGGAEIILPLDRIAEALLSFART
jgi:two-component system chemotaxis response regulator CheB